MRKILTMLFALVSVVAMGQEVKVDTVAADSLTADTVKADTYVEQEGMTVYAEIKDHFTHDPVKMRCVTLLMAADSAFVDTVPTYYENEEDNKSSHLYKDFKEAGKYLFKLEADGYLTMYSRRGYSEASMNTNELVWNARVSKRLPKQNLTILFDGFDLLGKLSNVRRYVNAQGRSETFYNVIPSYGLLHVIYRFNKEPKKK